MSNLSDHMKGLSITAFGVLVLSPDALLLRLLSIDPFTTVFWRGVLMFLTLAAAMAVVYRGRVDLAFRAVGRWGLLSSLIYAANLVAFIYSIANTAAANTLVIMAAAPLLAAIWSRLFLREPVALETWIATTLVIIGIAVVFWDGLGRGTWNGDLAGLAVALCLSANFTVLRHRKHINMVPATALGGLWGAIAVFLLGLTIPLSLNAQDVVVIAVLGLFVAPVAFGLITMGPRYITAPEVGLLMLLETILGPLWVWLALGQRASDVALSGGALVVGTLLVYFTIRLRRQTVVTPQTSG
ncbi:DMT family transporter [Ferruginivarius sediminum]|nr:DMT family transporter [Ferruginivarius sediminum]